MTDTTDETIDAALSSWVESAEDAATDFPIQNLPFGICRMGDAGARPVVAIGDQVLDLMAACATGLLTGDDARVVAACAQDGSLNPLLGDGRGSITRLRRAASRLLRRDGAEAAAARALGARILQPMRDAALLLPARVGDYTDFYASIHHASNVGSMFRPDNALLPNYKWVPIGYHGRASSIVASGTAVRRPWGQTHDGGEGAPVFGPSRRLDYEMEVGAVIATGSGLGESIPMPRAEEHVGGLCLVNDWSARDIQAWEYQPLGPFLAKNFATTVSPWLVTLDALAPFRMPAFARAEGDPAPLAYLRDEANERAGGFDITLEVRLRTTAMREDGAEGDRISIGRFRDMYWTVAQLVTHHASNGCNLRPGDLLASGTVSGSAPESRGCLLERTWRGAEPLTLSSGESRRFLEDGDEVIMRGWCERDGARRIGFGECRGILI